MSEDAIRKAYNLVSQRGLDPHSSFVFGYLSGSNQLEGYLQITVLDYCNKISNLSTTQSQKDELYSHLLELNFGMLKKKASLFVTSLSQQVGKNSQHQSVAMNSPSEQVLLDRPFGQNQYEPQPQDKQIGNGQNAIKKAMVMDSTDDFVKNMSDPPSVTKKLLGILISEKGINASIQESPTGQEKPNLDIKQKIENLKKQAKEKEKALGLSNQPLPSVINPPIVQDFTKNSQFNLPINKVADQRELTGIRSHIQINYSKDPNEFKLPERVALPLGQLNSNIKDSKTAEVHILDSTSPPKNKVPQPNQEGPQSNPYLHNQPDPISYDNPYPYVINQTEHIPNNQVPRASTNPYDHPNPYVIDQVLPIVRGQQVPTPGAENMSISINSMQPPSQNQDRLIQMRGNLESSHKIVQTKQVFDIKDYVGSSNSYNLSNQGHLSAEYQGDSVGRPEAGFRQDPSNLVNYSYLPSAAVQDQYYDPNIGQQFNQTYPNNKGFDYPSGQNYPDLQYPEINSLSPSFSGSSSIPQYSQHNCCICNGFNESLVITTGLCNHTVHINCILTHTMRQLDVNIIPKTCPLQDCPSELDIPKFINHLNPIYQDRLNTLSIADIFQESGDILKITPCIRCHEDIFHSHTNTHLECEKCGFVFCTKCMRESHQGFLCN